MAGISSKAAGSLVNKKLFNKGSELQNEEFSDGSGLEWYDTRFRQLDMQIGRWNQIDPVFQEGVDNDADESMEIKEGMKSQSPYISMDNDPIRHNDPNGDCPTCPIVWDVVQRTSQQAGPLAPEVELAGLAVLGAVALWEFGKDLISTSNGNSLVPLNAQAATAQYHQSLVKANATPKPTVSSVVQTQKKGPKDLVGDAKAAQQKEADAKARAAQRQAQTTAGKQKIGQSNQGTRGSHNSGGNKPGKHDKAEARRAREQKAADAKKVVEKKEGS